MNYESSTVVESKHVSGVAFVITRMSFARRMELMGCIRDLAAKCEFSEAGETPQDQLAAALLSGEMDRVYLKWGLRELIGLNIDGVAATPDTLASAGPEELFREAVAAVKAECGLSETERKN